VRRSTQATANHGKPPQTSLCYFVPTQYTALLLRRISKSPLTAGLPLKWVVSLANSLVLSSS